MDFSDYPEIITARRNWKEVFEPIFIQPEVIRGKLIGLGIFRNDIAHIRSLQSGDKAVFIALRVAVDASSRLGITQRRRVWMEQWVYLFSQLDEVEERVSGSWDAVRGLLGGKGANLFEMSRIGLPIPPGFTVTTEACNAYLAGGSKLPRRNVGAGNGRASKAIEKVTGKGFGDQKNPLLVSCRSGSKESMPGMMDTVLNIGLTDTTVEGLAALTQIPLRLGRLPPPGRGLRQGRAGNPGHRVRARAAQMKPKAGVKLDTELTTEHLKALTGEYKAIVLKHKGFEFRRTHRSAPPGHRGRLRELERQACVRLPQP